MAKQLRSRGTAKVPLQNIILDPSKALSVIQQYVSDKNTEPVPEGYYTIEDLVKHWGKGGTQCYKICKTALEIGMVEVILVRRGRNRVKAYRFKSL